MNRSLIVFIFSVLSIFISSNILAKDYKVEMLVFKNLHPNQASENNQFQQIDKMLSNANVWLIEPSMLINQATAIDNSSDYELLYHFSWGQESKPYSSSAAVNLTETDLFGWVKVYAKQLLFTNLDLEFDGYRMTEKRRIKLDEKHFFDHPKFGILMQVSRLEKNESEDSDTLMIDNNIVQSQ